MHDCNQNSCYELNTKSQCNTSIENKNNNSFYFLLKRLNEMNIHEKIKSKIRTISDFPKKGIMFRDVTTLLKDSEGFQLVINNFAKRYTNKGIDVVAGIEARGFILGAAIAFKLGTGFVPIRKKGKLPGEVESAEYQLEYGTDIIQIHKDAIMFGQRVLLVDDLIATGGTMLTAVTLIEKLGGKLVECACIIDLPEIGGSKKIEDKGYSVYKQVTFEGH